MIEKDSIIRFSVQLLELPLPDGFTWVVKDFYGYHGMEAGDGVILGKFRDSHSASDFAEKVRKFALVEEALFGAYDVQNLA